MIIDQNSLPLWGENSAPTVWQVRDRQIEALDVGIMIMLTIVTVSGDT